MRKRFLRVLTVAAVLMVSQLFAATVVFNPVQTIVDERDIATEGRTIVAVGHGQSTTERVVQGVTFKVISSLALKPQQVTYGGAFVGKQLDTAYRAVAPASGLSLDYRTILYKTLAAGSLSTLTFSGLVPKRTYLAQFWVHDAVDSRAPKRVTQIADQEAFANAVELKHSHAALNVTGGLGSYVTATFVADEATQTFYFKPTNNSVTALTAYQLRDITPAGYGATMILFR